jgi:hypothetical protein
MSPPSYLPPDQPRCLLLPNQPHSLPLLLHHRHPPPLRQLFLRAVHPTLPLSHNANRPSLVRPHQPARCALSPRHPATPPASLLFLPPRLLADRHLPSQDRQPSIAPPSLAIIRFSSLLLPNSSRPNPPTSTAASLPSPASPQRSPLHSPPLDLPPLPPPPPPLDRVTPPSSRNSSPSGAQRR